MSSQEVKLILSAFDNTKAAFQSLNGSLTGLTTKVAIIGAKLAAFQYLIGSVKDVLSAVVVPTARTGDELYKMSQKVGISVEALSGLRYAAELSDVSLEELRMGLGQFSQQLQAASQGGKEQISTFKALGIQYQDSSGKLRPMEELLLDVADRFRGMEDGAGKTALAMDLFGRSGANLIPYLNQGSEGIKKLNDEAKRMGVYFTTDGAKAAEKFNDNVKRLKTNFEGLGNYIGNILIPLLNNLFTGFSASDKPMIDRIKTQITAVESAIAKERDKYNPQENIIKSLERERDRLKKLLETEIKNKKEEEAKKPAPIIDKEAEEKRLKAIQKSHEAWDKLTQAKREARKHAEEVMKEEEDFWKERDKEKESAYSSGVQWEASMKEGIEERARRESELNKKNLDEKAEAESRERAIREAQINHQLSLIDLAEKEHRISKKDAITDRIKLTSELQTIQKEHLATMVKENNTTAWYAQQDAITKTRDRLVELNFELKRQTGQFSEGFKYGLDDYIRNVKSKFDTATDLARTTAQSMESAFSDFFFDSMQGKLKSFSDYFNSFMLSVQRAIAQIIAQQTAQGIVAGVAGLWGGSGSGNGSPLGIDLWGKGGIGNKHKGGIVAHEGSYFIPKFHFGGLNSDESLTINKIGERYITKEQNEWLTGMAKTMQNKGNVNVVVNVENKSSHPVDAQVGNMKIDMYRHVIGIILKDIQGNGPLRGAIQGVK